ncbi:acyltransferase family protein [Microvirga sp. RSM25]|uniref:acyltransferase family protein n=1 Tax=Microvirga sp. RSM25 TaxID=3273802 RepID=UPI00384FF957
MPSDLIRTLCFRASRDAVIPGLDGLRCYAALFVILAHSNLVAPGWGATGVWLFFVLSGLLLTPSLVRAVRSTSALREVAAYVIRRVFRIMPALIVVVAVACVVIWAPKRGIFNLELFWQHVTFQVSRWHLWTTKTEMLLYLVLPIIVWAMAALQGWRLAVGLALVLAGSFWLTEHSTIFIIRTDLKREMSVYATPFLLGMALAFVTPAVARLRKLSFWIGAVGLVALSSDIAPLIAFRESVGIPVDNLPWRIPILIYPFAGLTVFGAAGNASWILNNRVVTTIGVVGFSVYLWQTFVLHVLRRNGIADPVLLFTLVLPLTLFLSFLTYHLIEVPGQRLGAKIADSISARKARVGKTEEERLAAL